MCVCIIGSKDFIYLFFLLFFFKFWPLVLVGFLDGLAAQSKSIGGAGKVLTVEPSV